MAVTFCYFFILRDRKSCFFLAKKKPQRGNGFYFQTVTLQMLYKLKTSKVFEKPKAGEGRAAELVEEDPFAVQMVSWCPQSRIFCVVGISAHIILYRFSKYEANNQIVVSEKEIPKTKTNWCYSVFSNRYPDIFIFVGFFFVMNHSWGCQVFSEQLAPTLTG